VAMTPTVSVVMAARNYARFLPQAVESVFAQTVRDWELVIVDDGSTDATPAAARPFLADRRVRYVRADRLGQSRAKNLGVGLTRGPFVAFLDADDAWHPDKLERQLTLFAAPAVGVVHCGRTVIDEAGRPVGRPAPAGPRGRVLAELFVYNSVCFSSVVVRRRVFEHVGGFDPGRDLAIDYDFWLRVARHYMFEAVSDELVLYRTGHGNLSRKLSDRVATALSITHRAETRYGVRDAVPAPVRDEAYASTCRTMGYVMRDAEPLTAARWYAAALRRASGRIASAKGLLACLLRAPRRREAGSAENATENV
ncbi:MAG: glycosyltransferase family 2 protein, partial [Gemmataceae bacterium]|nr:glycosyltransferase family 2 protein [Gemmataceae bacterium]